MEDHVLAPGVETPPAWRAGLFARACRSNDLAAVQELTSPAHMAACRSGTVDLNAVDWTHWTGFYLACVEGHTELVRYLTSPALLAAGLDVNMGSASGTSPLAVAAFKGHVEVVRHLLESPDLAAAGVTVDVNSARDDGLTALHRACSSNHAGPEVVSLLLRQPQLDLGARTKDGKTALQVAEINTWADGHGAEKAALVRAAMQLPMARLYVLMVALWSRREGRRAVTAAAMRSGAGVGAGPEAPSLSVLAGTPGEEDEEVVARRRLIAEMPSTCLMLLCQLSG